MRFEETALSTMACSRSALSRCGDCRVNSSCLPMASPRSARYQPVAAGIEVLDLEICCTVIMVQRSRLMPGWMTRSRLLHFEVFDLRRRGLILILGHFGFGDGFE